MINQKIHTSSGWLFEVIISEEYGFFSEGKDITKAGNQATRADYYTDIVVGLRDTNPTFISPEFAPGIGFEDYTSLEISNKTKQKVKEIELKLRAACIAALELEGPKKITKYLNSEYQRTIDRGLEQEKNWVADVSIFTEEKKFEYLSLSQLFEIMMKRLTNSISLKKDVINER